ncbi:MAG: carboxypeptidase-like regulatory domain-containing protein [Thermonemataceae bacterium]
MRNIVFYLVALIATSTFTGCGDDLTPDIRTNTLFGFVEARDEFDVLADDEGFTVNLIDRECNAIASTVTDANGRYEFPDVAFGTYEVTFDKEGYNTYRLTSKLLEIEGPAPVLLERASIKATSTTEVSNMNFREQFSTNYRFDLNLSPNEEDRFYTLFLSTSDSVSRENYQWSFDGPISFGVAETTFFINGSDLAQYFEDGTTVYIVAYGRTGNVDSYQDINTQQAIFYATNNTPSNVISFTYNEEEDDVL